ncbi:hypothetical protein TWF694_002613 [Orbilia ellipsospora]|uniref:PA14 domain-containing protein n=1 Tax=Orbilia ellipsospora TaxID=2528407 RepID=A0AAV9X2I8_9PEZI
MSEEITDEFYSEAAFLAAISKSDVGPHPFVASVLTKLRSKVTFSRINEAGFGTANDEKGKEIRRAVSVLAQFESLTKEISIFRNIFPGPSIFSVLAAKGIANANDAIAQNPRTSSLFEYYDAPSPRNETELRINIDLWTPGSPYAVLLMVALYHARNGTLGVPSDLASDFISVSQGLFNNRLGMIPLWKESVGKMLAQDSGKPSIGGVETVYKRDITNIFEHLGILYRLTEDHKMSIFLYSKGYQSPVEISKSNREEFAAFAGTENPAWKSKALKIWDTSVDMVTKTAYHGLRIIQRKQRTGLPVLDRKDLIKLDVTLAVEGQLDGYSDDYIPLTYENLFGSHMVASCPHGCNTVLSPTAYFVDLMQFLRYSRSNSLEEEGAERFSVLTHLLARRPDLEDLELSCENAILTVPYIDLANEVMESWVYSRLPKELEWVAPDSEPLPSKTMRHRKPRDVRSSRIDARNNSAKQTTAELSACPAIIKDEIYQEKIGKVVFPIGLFPYNYAFDTIRVILKAMGTSRVEILSLFQPNQPSPISGEQPKTADTTYLRCQAAERFGFIEEDFLAITGQGFQQVSDITSSSTLRKGVEQYWGYSSVADLNAKLPLVKDQFLIRSDLKLKDLADILLTRFINGEVSEDEKVVIVVPPNHDFRKVTLTHSDGKPLSLNTWDTFQRFIRLWKALKCSFQELDTSLSIVNSLESLQKKRLITPIHILNLNTIYQIVDATGLSLIETLNFWTFSLFPESLQDTISETEAKLFLGDHNISRGQHIRSKSVSEMLRIDASDMVTLKACSASFGGHNGFGDQPTAKNIAQAYRIIQLANVLGLTLADLAKLAKTSFYTKYGSPFRTTATTLTFIKKWKEAVALGFQLQDILKIDNAQRDETRDAIQALLPIDQRPDVLRSCKLIYELRNYHDEIKKRYPTLLEASLEDAQRLSAVIFDNSTIARLVAFLQGGEEEVTEQVKQEKSQFYYSTLYDLLENYPGIEGLLDQKVPASAKRLLFCNALSFVIKKKEEDAATLTAISASGIKISDPTVLRALVFNIKMAGKDGLSTVQQSLQQTMLDSYLSRPVFSELKQSFQASSGDEASRVVSVPGQATYPEVFEGFLIPKTSEKYRFTANKATSSSIKIYVNGKLRDLKKPQGNDAYASSDLISFEAGTVYQLKLEGILPQNIIWRAVNSGDMTLEDSAFVISKSLQEMVESTVLEQLEAASLTAEYLKLTLEELTYIQSEKSRFQEVDFGKLSYSGFQTLLSYQKLKGEIKIGRIDLITFLKLVDKESDSLIMDPKNLELVAQVFGVSVPKATQALGIAGGEKKLGEVLTLDFLLRMQKQFSVLLRLQKWDINLNTLSEIASPQDNGEYALASKLKSIYDTRTGREAWIASAGGQVYDHLRANRRKVLSIYLLQQDELQKQGVRDENALFEYFLIDTQMGPELRTSRIRQAISTIQLFIQRCLLGLETSNGVPTSAIDAKRWDWMRKYSVWEPNRRIFLYPENWIDPSLRDNKTEVWSKFEAGLQQRNLTEDIIHAGLRTYISSLYDIRSLSIQGVYKELQNHPFSEVVPRKTGPEDRELDDEYASEISEIKAIHYFGRTASAPYQYYYCKWIAKSSTWTSWEKIEVDIPTHEFDLSSSSGGTPLPEPAAFLVPAVWQGRLLLFLPEFRVCVVNPPEPEGAGNQNPPSLGGVFKEMGKRSSIPYHEIRISWTEYRHGRWTPLQTSSPPIISNFYEDDYVGKIPVEKWQSVGYKVPETPQRLPSLSDYTFVTGVLGQCNGSLTRDTTLCLNIKRRGLGTIKSLFMIGGQLAPWGHRLSRSEALSGVDLDLNFSRYKFKDGTIGVCTYQDMRVDSKLVKYYPYSSDRQLLHTTVSLPREKGSTVQNFYNELSPPLLNSSRTNNLEDIFHTFLEKWSHVSSECFGNEKKTLLWHEMRSPYSIYNWELGIHAPMLLMDRLLKSQQFDLALKLGKCIFNPHAVGGAGAQGLASCWNWPVFFQLSAEEAMASALGKYNPTKQDIAVLNQAVEEWRSSPFQPYVIARGRPLAYMKWVVVKYLEILVAYGDSYFRQNSFDTLPTATQLYIQAAHIYGTPEVQPVSMAEMNVYSYGMLKQKGLDRFSDSVVDMSYRFPFQSTHKGKVPSNSALSVAADTAASIMNLASTRYFSVPLNPKIAEIGSIIKDRLTKIRSCLDINGIPISIPLFDAPIEPGLLVQAVSKGGLGAISSLSDSLSKPMPNYRFVYTFQRAIDMCQELKSLASTYLGIREKRDAEALSILRGQQDTTISTMTLKIKQLALDDARIAFEALQQSRLAAESRMDYYLRLIGEPKSRIPSPSATFVEIEQDIDKPTIGSLRMSPEETAEFLFYGRAEILRIWSHADKVRAGIFKTLPKVEVQAQPMGVGGSTALDPEKMAAAMELAGEIKTGLATVDSFAAGTLSRISTLKGQLRERRLQANSAGYDIKNIDVQIANQRVKIELAEKDLEIQKKQIENAKVCEEFLRTKYTNEQLYTWMDNTFQQYLYQTYVFAFDMARAAEKTYSFEKGEQDISYIKFGYWNVGNQGLGCAEDLWLSLKRMEVDYMARKPHDYEIVKHFSLRQLNPTELFRLRDSGKAELNIPEVMYDLDFPGHYARRIKSVSLTIPCIIGPYTTVNCVLRLVDHRYRIDASKAQSYEERKQSDPRFRTMQVPIQSIATSSGQNDSGVFELQFRDDRYIPFEGAGAISRWSLELPNKFRQFNYSAISDIVLHIKYTSKDGGELLKKEAENSVAAVLENPETSQSQIVLDLRADFSTEWHRFTKTQLEGRRTITLENLNRMLPYLATYRGINVTKVHLFTTYKANPEKEEEKIIGEYIIPGSETRLTGSFSHVVETGHGLELPHKPRLEQYSVVFKDMEKYILGDLKLSIKGVVDVDDKFYVVLDYNLKKSA